MSRIENYNKENASKVSSCVITTSYKQTLCVSELIKEQVSVAHSGGAHLYQFLMGLWSNSAKNVYLL